MSAYFCVRCDNHLGGVSPGTGNLVGHGLHIGSALLAGASTLAVYTLAAVEDALGGVRVLVDEPYKSSQ